MCCASAFDKAMPQSPLPHPSSRHCLPCKHDTITISLAYDTTCCTFTFITGQGRILITIPSSLHDCPRYTGLQRLLPQQYYSFQTHRLKVSCAVRLLLLASSTDCFATSWFQYSPMARAEYARMHVRQGRSNIAWSNTSCLGVLSCHCSSKRYPFDIVLESRLDTRWDFIVLVALVPRALCTL